MSLEREVESAIKKLETLKADSAPGRWEHWPEAGTVEIYTNAPHPSSRSTEYVIASSVVPRMGYGKAIYVDNYEPNAELIVVLHRTIDMQLRILRGALGGARDLDQNATPDEPASTVDALELARVINEDSK